MQIENEKKNAFFQSLLDFSSRPPAPSATLPPF